MKEKIEKIINRIKNLFKNNKKPYFPKDYEKNPDVIVWGDNSKAIDPPYVFVHNKEEIKDENFKDSIKVDESEMNKTADKEINAGEEIKEMEK